MYKEASSVLSRAVPHLCCASPVLRCAVQWRQAKAAAGPVAEAAEDGDASVMPEADLCAPPEAAELRLMARMGMSWWDRYWVSGLAPPPQD